MSKKIENTLLVLNALMRNKRVTISTVNIATGFANVLYLNKATETKTEHAVAHRINMQEIAEAGSKLQRQMRSMKFLNAHQAVVKVLDQKFKPSVVKVKKSKAMAPTKQTAIRSPRRAMKDNKKPQVVQPTPVMPRMI